VAKINFEFKPTAASSNSGSKHVADAEQLVDAGQPVGAEPLLASAPSIAVQFVITDCFIEYFKTVGQHFVSCSSFRSSC